MKIIVICGAEQLHATPTVLNVIENATKLFGSVLPIEHVLQSQLIYFDHNTLENTRFFAVTSNDKCYYISVKQ